MTNRNTPRFPVLVTALAAGIAAAGSAAAQDISLNYESLSSMEEPLAVEIGDTTFVLTGLVDASAAHDAHDDAAGGGDLTANFELGALTQLPNRWRLGLTWFGQYSTDDDSDAGSDAGSDERYTDNVALSVGSVWGTVLGGNVSGVVREQTRRRRGAGNGNLAFDGALGELAARSGGYVGRFGPWVTSAVADEDGNFDLGAMFQRPAGNRDYRLTVRATEGVYKAVDGSRRFDTTAAGVVGEMIYASTSIDVGAGYERLSSNGPDADRWYVSSGVRTKTGVVSASVEGHYGRIGGEDEVSAALGLQYDVARGLSLNLGLNRASAQVTLDGTSLADTRETRIVLSLRYSF